MTIAAAEDQPNRLDVAISEFHSWLMALEFLGRDVHQIREVFDEAISAAADSVEERDDSIKDVGRIISEDVAAIATSSAATLAEIADNLHMADARGLELLGQTLRSISLRLDGIAHTANMRAALRR